MASEVSVERGRTKAALTFPPTSWELLIQASLPDTRGEPALHELSDRYYGAIRAYIVAIVRDPVEGDDLTQRFFVNVVLSRRLLANANPARGSFRPYLKQAIRNFLVDEHRGRQRRKARADQPDVRPDSLEGGWDRVIGSRSPGPDQEFRRAWGRSLVRLALGRVKRICEQKGQRVHFQLFAGRFLADPEPGWRELGARFGLDEKRARSRADVVARLFRAVLRELVAAEVSSEADVDAEIRVLMAIE